MATSPHHIDPSTYLDELLTQASPDLMRQMLQSFDWAMLAGMATSDREDYVREKATQRAQDAARACWG